MRLQTVVAPLERADRKFGRLPRIEVTRDEKIEIGNLPFEIDPPRKHSARKRTTPGENSRFSGLLPPFAAHFEPEFRGKIPRKFTQTR